MATVELDPQQLLIGGEWVPASSGRAWDSSGPVEGVGATPVAAAGPDDVARAAEAAAAAFPAWSNTPPGERRALLHRAADLLQDRSEQIAAIVTEETGGTFGWGMFNCGLAAGMLRRGGRPGVRADRRGHPLRRARAARARRAPAGGRDRSGSRRGTRR